MNLKDDCFLTVDEAVGLLINFPQEIKSGSVSIQDFLDHTDEMVKSDQARGLCVIRNHYIQSIIDNIDEELRRIDKGQESNLIIDNSGHVTKISKSSLCYWASTELFIKIPGTMPPLHWQKQNDRQHYTLLLGVLDSVITTFYEEGGEHYSQDSKPKKAAIEGWLDETYPNIDSLSQKVRDAIFTIVSSD